MIPKEIEHTRGTYRPAFGITRTSRSADGNRGMPGDGNTLVKRSLLRECLAAVAFPIDAGSRRALHCIDEIHRSANARTKAEQRSNDD